MTIPARSQHSVAAIVPLALVFSLCLLPQAASAKAIKAGPRDSAHRVEMEPDDTFEVSLPETRSEVWTVTSIPPSLRLLGEMSEDGLDATEMPGTHYFTFGVRPKTAPVLGGSLGELKLTKSRRNEPGEATPIEVAVFYIRVNPEA